jgi:hypothetical protein
MNVDVRTDWTMTGIASYFEEQLVGFKWEGPGWYLGKDGETLLIIPVGDHPDPFRYKENWDKDQQFRVMVWSENPGQAFSEIAHAPTRVDNR